MKNKANRQSERTRQHLSNVLMLLMIEKPYSAITVQEIVDRAHVGRSTFYTHFQDKNDLLPSEVGRLIEQLSQDIDSEGMDNHQLFPSLALFRHAKQYYPLYKAALMWPQGLDIVYRTAQARISRHIEKQLDDMLANQRKPSIPTRVLADYVAGSFVALFKWWLDNKLTYSPEHMEEIFKRLVMPGLQATLGRTL